MSIYSNTATYGGGGSSNYGGGSSHRPHHSHSQSHRPQASGQIYAGQGGGRQGGQSYKPAGADDQLWGFFNAVDADGSGNISVNELQAALVNGECGTTRIGLMFSAYDCKFVAF